MGDNPAGGGSASTLTNGNVIGMAVGGLAVFAIVVFSITYIIIRKDNQKDETGKKMPL